MKDEKEEAPEDLRKRTKKFALRIIRLFGAIPKSTEAQVIGKQLLRSGTSIGAHYREACRARSDAEFVSKLETALMELDESLYWIELLIEGGIIKDNLLNPLMDEANQLIAIMVTCVKKVKKNNNG